MTDYHNPFEYEAANKFSPDELIGFFIDDYNYSRFIRSTRNISVEGARGTGKTMMLLYNSLPVQQRKAEHDNARLSLNVSGIYIPCNTPLTHRQEYRLLPDFQASTLSTHFLVLTMMHEIVNTFSQLRNLDTSEVGNAIREELSFVLSMDIPQTADLFHDLKMAFQREVLRTQSFLNQLQSAESLATNLTFASGVLPLLAALRKLPPLYDTHFSLMLDDAQDLNSHQIEAVNSWIAYRDHSLFSFKIATTKARPLSRRTSSGGAILPGHDFTSIDLEQPYQNRQSAYGKMARQIVERRLRRFDIDTTPEDFFPENPAFRRDLEACKENVRKEAEQKYGGDHKRITDYVYKYGRAEYFRSRSTKANRPPYSGFDLIVHLSTGVIRNLLEPCFWMYDRVVSEQGPQDGYSPPQAIPPAIQTEIILELSKRKWDWARDSLDNAITGCSRENAVSVFHMLDRLADLFRSRLLKHQSEPRAITFSISEQFTDEYAELKELLQIAREAQLIYQYTSTAKDHARTDTYYVPNRILWPARGLDPHGQHARVSIKARDLLAAARENIAIPSEGHEELESGGLFDG